MNTFFEEGQNRLNYNGYEIILIEKDKKVWLEECVTLHVVDIIIKKDNKEYVFNNYYIKLTADVINFGDALAKRIIENMQTITFKHSKFIGEVIRKGNDILVENDSEISDQLSIKQRSDKDDEVLKLYEIYQTLKDKEDRNIALKYAAFFEVRFNTKPIPDVIREKVFNQLDKDDELFAEPIFDYGKLDERVKEEFVRNTSCFYERTNELIDNYKQLCRFNNYLELTGSRVTMYENFLQNIDVFLEEKNKFQNSEDKEQIDKRSLFSFQLKKEKPKKTKEFDKREEYRIRSLIINTLTEKHIIDIDIELIKILPITDIRRIMFEKYNIENENNIATLKKYKEIESYEKKYNPNINLNMLEGYIKDLSFEDLYAPIDASITSEISSKSF